MLYGRDAELAVIDGLLAQARAGASGALVLVGAPGTGKSALLAEAAGRAAGARVLRAQGVESEAELAFATLHQLLLPVLDRVERLPAPQAAALGAALGVRPPAGGDRFLVAAGLLSLLAEAAEDGVLLCLIDDLQWADWSSAAALGFVARRLMAEGVVLLAAARDGDQDWAGRDALPVLPIGGLDSASAAALLAEQSDNGLIPQVRDTLVAATGGNPLALAELPTLLSADQRAGRASLPDPLPLSDALTQAFAARAGCLAPRARRLLLLLAAAGHGDLGPLLRAGAQTGAGSAEVDQAEAAGLVRVGAGTVEFCHPLVRSAVYRDAPVAERRAAHRALARALDAGSDADMRAWHLAAATVTPDEDAAAALEGSAGRARQRAGHAAAAAALSRAAELTPDQAERARRLLAAADAAWLAGQAERSRALLDRASQQQLTIPARAELAYAQGRLAATSGAPEDGYRLLAEAAALITPDRPELAAKILLEAAHIPVITGDFRPLRELVGHFRGWADGSPGQAGLAEYLSATERLAAGHAVQGLAELRQAIERLAAAADGRPRALAAVSAIAAGDDAATLVLAGATVSTLRRQGLMAWLPLGLQHLAAAEALTSRYQAAVADASEGMNLAGETGQSFPAAMCRSVLAWVAAVRGDQDCVESHAQHVLGAAGQAAIRPAAGSALWALGLLDLGLGRPQQALQRLHRLAVSDPPYPVLAHATGDVVEAAVRAGRPELAAAVRGSDRPGLPRLAELTKQPWALAVLARCRALLAGRSTEAEAHFQAAAQSHAAATRPFEQARTELLYGEWLRRARRPRQAREHLRAALDTFTPLHATPWADRARNELRAAGETVSQRDNGGLGQLTPREIQIIRMVSDGATNREIAAQLFLSPRTIDYYLHKIFTKLGVRSRVELARLGHDCAG